MIYNYEPDELYSSGDPGGEALEHYGVSGQKWGVKHGPPYPLVEGTKKITYNLGKMTEKTKAAVKKKTASIRVSRAAKADVKNTKKTNISEAGPKQFVKSKQRISDMSSEELKARIDRLKLEQEYKKYVNGDASVQKKVDSGKKVTDSILYNIGKELAVGFAKTAVAVHNEKRLDAIRRSIDARNRHKELLKEIRKDNREVELSRRKAEASAYGKAIGEQNAKYEQERMDREHAMDEARRRNEERNVYNSYKARHTQNRRRRSSYYTSDD